ncbi:MAG TPA: hypothetical protein VN519_06705 [Bryobacteraceae bacterium]|nr:hypothetical protein [Bryobacteraceae bacterium]
MPPKSATSAQSELDTTQAEDRDYDALLAENERLTEQNDAMAAKLTRLEALVEKALAGGGAVASSSTAVNDGVDRFAVEYALSEGVPVANLRLVNVIREGGTQAQAYQGTKENPGFSLPAGVSPSRLVRDPHKRRNHWLDPNTNQTFVCPEGWQPSWGALAPMAA